MFLLLLLIAPITCPIMCSIFYVFYIFLSIHFNQLESIILEMAKWSFGRFYYKCKANGCRWYILAVKVTLKSMIFPFCHITGPLFFSFLFQECLAHARHMCARYFKQQWNKYCSVLREYMIQHGREAVGTVQNGLRSWLTKGESTTVTQKWSLV